MLVLGLVGQGALATVGTASHEFPFSQDLNAMVTAGAVCSLDDIIDGCSTPEAFQTFYLWEVRYCVQHLDAQVTILLIVNGHPRVITRSVPGTPDKECTTLQETTTVNGPVCVELEAVMVPIGVDTANPYSEDRDLECGVPGIDDGVKAPVLSDA